MGDPVQWLSDWVNHCSGLTHCPKLNWTFISQKEKSAPATTRPTPGTATPVSTAAAATTLPTSRSLRPPSRPAPPRTTPTQNPGIRPRRRRFRREIQTSRSGVGGVGPPFSTCRMARSPSTASEINRMNLRKLQNNIFPIYVPPQITSPFNWSFWSVPLKVLGVFLCGENESHNHPPTRCRDLKKTTYTQPFLHLKVVFLRSGRGSMKDVA